MSTRPNEIRNPVSDTVPAEKLLGVGVGVEDRTVDADNQVARTDPGEICTRSLHNLSHLPSTRGVGLEDYAVVGTRQVHVDDRQRRQQECEHTWRKQQCEPPSTHGHQKHDTPIVGSRFAVGCSRPQRSRSGSSGIAEPSCGFARSRPGELRHRGTSIPAGSGSRRRATRAFPATGAAANRQARTSSPSRATASRDCSA